MKRDGNVIMLVLIVSTVCMVSVAFAMESVFIQNMLVLNRRDNIQAGLSLEGKLLELIYDDKQIYTKIEDLVCNFRNPNNGEGNIQIEIDNVKIEKSEILFGYCEDERLTFKMVIDGESNGIFEKIEANGHVFNPIIDHCMNGLITIQNKSLEYAEALSELLNYLKSKFDKDNVPSNYFIANNFLENDVLIKAGGFAKDSKIYLNSENHQYEYNAVRGNIVIFKEYDGFARDTIRIEKHPGTVGDGFLKGMIYIEEGDLILSGDLNIGAIIILENGNLIKEGDGEVTIYGKVIINNYDQPDDDVIITYSYDILRQMARFLPGFISPGIDSIR